MKKLIDDKKHYFCVCFGDRYVVIKGTVFVADLII